VKYAVAVKAESKKKNKKKKTKKHKGISPCEVTMFNQNPPGSGLPDDGQAFGTRGARID